MGIVTWAMLPPGVTELTIEFGLDESYGQRASVAFTGADAHGVLLGLKPNHTYHYRLVARGASATAPDAEAGAAETGAAEAGAAHTLYVEEDARFTTGAAPSALGIGDYRIQDPEAHARGFWVASYWNGTGGNFAFILDADGEVVWSYQFVALGIARTMLSADGQSVWIISPSNSGAQLSRVSIDTLMVEDYPTLSGSHDIAAIDGQQMAYLDYSETDCNSIFLLDPSGSLSELWDSEPEVGALTPNCHGNALRYWPAADLFTYSDLAHDVFAINRAGAVVWRLSERIPGGSAAWGGRNHGHDLQGSQLLLFANQGGPEQSSAVIEYDLDTGAELWRYETEYSSTNLGDVQRLPNGNRLITYSNAKVLQEVTPDKRVVAQWSAPASPGYIGFRESLYVTR